MTLLLAFAADAAAQALSHVLAFSSPAVHALDQERAMDLQMIDSIAGKRRASNFRAVERPEVWTLYGRAGPINFTNQLRAGSDGVQFTLRRNSHGLSGNIYVGLHRRF